jgi:ArsR family transcriptional regulator, arsenate/arsenite/antimonite-responsive transcriptional repressor
MCRLIYAKKTYSASRLTSINAYGKKIGMKATVDVFKSLADETRLRLLLLLQGRAELCVCDLMHALDMKQSTVSRHLAYLKKNGWLQDRRGGVWMYYSLKKDLIPLLQSELVLIISILSNTEICRGDQERLNSYLETKDGASCT